MSKIVSESSAADIEFENDSKGEDDWVNQNGVYVVGGCECGDDGI